MSIEVSDFNKEVIEQSYKTPVLVDFWAEWCAPCRMLGPVLDKLAEKYKGRFILAKLDTDANQDIAAKYGIRGIPNVKLFLNGQPVDEFQGALPENMIEKWLDKALPSEEKELLGNARQLLTADPAEAKRVLEKLIAEHPDNFEIKVLLAKALLFEDPAKAVSLTGSYENEPEFMEEASSVNTIAKLIERKRSGYVFPDDPVKGKYLEAVDELEKQNFDPALEKFIDVIRDNRTYDDDGARKVCIAIFKYLGEEHPITLKHRRPFGSALYI